MPQSGAGELTPWNAFTTTNGPWEGPTTGNNPLTGRHFTGPCDGYVVWWPASGIRSYAGSTLSDTGTGSGSWTSAVSGQNAAYFYITYGGVPPYVWNTRCYGLPVRCIRE